MKISGFVMAMALGVLAGCSTPSFTMPPGPPEYRAGYQNGCDIGYAVAGSPFASAPDQATAPAKGDPQRIGWLAGYDQCKQSYQRMQGVISSVFGPA